MARTYHVSQHLRNNCSKWDLQLTECSAVASVVGFSARITSTPTSSLSFQGLPSSLSQPHHMLSFSDTLSCLNIISPLFLPHDQLESLYNYNFQATSKPFLLPYLRFGALPVIMLTLIIQSSIFSIST